MFEWLPPGRRWAAFLLLLGCHIYFFQIYPHFQSPNEVSRLLLTSAILDHQTLHIDKAMQRYGYPQDKAFYNGHYYSDKAIGVSLISLPPLALVRLIETLFGFRFATPMTIFLIRSLVITIPSLLFLRLLTRVWKKLKPDSTCIPHFAFLYVFGTTTFTYSTQLISHVLLGITLFCSAVFLYQSKPHQSAKSILLCGIFAGISLLLEYPAVIPVALIGLFAVYWIRNPGRLLYFALPVAAAVALVLSYNTAIFGTPWDVTYRHMDHPAHSTHHVEGIVGITMPSLEALHGLLFSRHHGLFFISPFLLLAFPGFYRMTRSNEWSFLANLFIGIIMTIVLVYSGATNWMAGWNFGPRYLTSVVPFFATAAFYYGDNFLSMNRLRRTVLAGIAIWSVLCVTIGTITFPFPPYNVRDPIFFLNFPLLLHGATSINIAGNPWPFFPLLIGTWLVMTYPVGAKQWNVETRVAAGASSLSAVLFIIAFLSRPAPTAMEYYARGSIYLYTGKYAEAFAEMEQALQTDPDANTEGLVRRRMTDLLSLQKQHQGSWKTLRQEH